jgi:hypothetical protein
LVDNSNSLLLILDQLKQYRKLFSVVFARYYRVLMSPSSRAIPEVPNGAVIQGDPNANGVPRSPVMEQTSVAPHLASVYSPNDGSSMTSHAHSSETPFSGADVAIMAEAFRKALRKPDFAGPIGDSPEGQEQKDNRLLNRELAEEGRDIRNVGSSRDVRVETLSDAEDKAKDTPRRGPR